MSDRGQGGLLAIGKCRKAWHYEKMDGDLILRLRAAGLVVAGVAVLTVMTRPVLAAEQVHDEIQVYNAEIAEVGQWTIEQHLNYASRGQTQPEFPGAFVSNRSLQG